jgi:adenylate cyclase class 2
MQYEVEQKHRVDDGWDAVVRLATYGAKLGEPISQTDTYFAHPARDFAKSDEALRIRTESTQSFVTYKGPKLDTTTKTRQELELPLGETGMAADRFAELLQVLGFSPVAVVRKHRRSFRIGYEGHDVEGAYDLVDGLGAFVELELKTDEAGLDEAKRIIAKLATELDLGPSVLSSYLEMLLDKAY